jgi:hypothetical protein
MLQTRGQGQGASAMRGRRYLSLGHFERGLQPVIRGYQFETLNLL